MAKDVMSLMDLSKEELREVLDLSHKYRKDRSLNNSHLKRKTIGLIFLKNSTRTRVSFETGVNQLGGYPMYMDQNSLQVGRGESFEDTARVLSRYLDGIVIRGHKHEDIKAFADACTVPVINALTDTYHPCQLLADMQLVENIRGSLEGAKVTFYGDTACNMALSWINAAHMTGMELTLAGPEKFHPPKEFLANLGNPSNIKVTSDAKEAAKGAEFFYTDVWVSMGFEEEAKERLKIFKPYQVNSELVGLASKDVKVLHCLPAYREKEITAEVLEGPHSVVWDQAENRLHAQKAVMTLKY
ncbi:MAG: ornithine carbamoyltransferase [Lentisphaeraceae bacterium]|nr:ornithine carbamoyltransferase [Lentisphaeraceae bacterium]